MGKRTSLYLSDDLATAAAASGLPLAELVRRGINGPPVLTNVVPVNRRAVERGTTIRQAFSGC